MGSWLKEAIFNRDYPVLQGGILFLAIVFVLVNLRRRHLVRVPQPADQAELMSVAEIQEVALELEHPTGGLWRDAFRRLRRNPARSSASSSSASSSWSRSSRR